MKRNYLLNAVMLSVILFSCKKGIDNPPQKAENQFNSKQTQATTLAVSNVITMDQTGDYIQSPYNTIRNNTTGMLYATIEQGAGYTGRDVNNNLIERSLVKTTTKRSGSYGLLFNLPKRDSTITYDQNDRTGWNLIFYTMET